MKTLGGKRRKGRNFLIIPYSFGIWAGRGRKEGKKYVNMNFWRLYSKSLSSWHLLHSHPLLSRKGRERERGVRERQEAKAPQLPETSCVLINQWKWARILLLRAQEELHPSPLHIPGPPALFPTLLLQPSFREAVLGKKWTWQFPLEVLQPPLLQQVQLLKTHERKFLSPKAIALPNGSISEMGIVWSLEMTLKKMHCYLSSSCTLPILYVLSLPHPPSTCEFSDNRNWLTFLCFFPMLGTKQVLNKCFVIDSFI